MSERETRPGTEVPSSLLFGSRSILERLCYGVLVWARKGEEQQWQIERLRHEVAQLEKDLKQQRERTEEYMTNWLNADLIVDQMRKRIRRFLGRGERTFIVHPGSGINYGKLRSKGARVMMEDFRTGRAHRSFTVHPEEPNPSVVSPAEPAKEKS